MDNTRELEDTIFGYFGRFELYSITIGKLVGKQEKLRSIHFDGFQYDEVYERDEDDSNFWLGKPLPLKGPKYASSGDERDLCLVFGELNHNWWYEIPREEEGKGSIVKDIEDPYTGSTARICYEIIPRGVDARFEFRFEDSEDRLFKIVKGEIIATTKGNADTKRVLRSFGYEKNNTEVLEPKQKMPLHRPRVGVPCGSEIHLTVSLICEFVSPTVGKRKTSESNFTITGSHFIGAPDNPKEEYLYFPVSNVGPGLSVKVTWLDALFIALDTDDEEDLL